MISKPENCTSLTITNLTRPPSLKAHMRKVICILNTSNHGDIPKNLKSNVADFISGAAGPVAHVIGPARAPIANNTQ